MTDRQKLQLEIEQMRSVLDKELEHCDDLMDCYELNCKMDKLIEQYLDLDEKEKLVPAGFESEK